MIKTIYTLLLFFLVALPLSGEELSLEESIAIALRENPIIHRSDKAIEGARAKKREAITDFLPTLGTASTYTKYDEEYKTTTEATTMTGAMAGVPLAFNIPGSTSISRENELYDINLNVKQSLFTGGKLSSLYRQAKENLKLQVNNFKMTEQELVYQVKEAYFNVLGTEKFKKVASETVERMEVHLSQVKDLYEVGMVPKINILQTKVKLAQARQNLIQAENSLALSQASFNNLLNRNLEEEVHLVDISGYQSQEKELAQCIKTALRFRPELDILKAQVNIAKESVDVAQSDYFPQVSLRGNWDQTKGSRAPLDAWEEEWNVVLSFDLDIWNWTATGAGVKQAQAELEQLKDDFKLLGNKIKLEVQSAYLSRKAWEKQIQTAEEGFEEARENLQNTQLRFKEGLSTSTDVLDAQVLLSEAEYNYYYALYNHYIAEAKLEKATGKDSRQVENALEGKEKEVASDTQIIPEK